MVFPDKKCLATEARNALGFSKFLAWSSGLRGNILKRLFIDIAFKEFIGPQHLVDALAVVSASCYLVGGARVSYILNRSA